MNKSKTKRKTRSDKFQLTLHSTGQYCKKIKGKMHYFGKDKKQALERYLEQAAFLHSIAYCYSDGFRILCLAITDCKCNLMGTSLCVARSPYKLLAGKYSATGQALD